MKDGSQWWSRTKQTRLRTKGIRVSPRPKGEGVGEEKAVTWWGGPGRGAGQLGNLYTGVLESGHLIRRQKSLISFPLKKQSDQIEGEKDVVRSLQHFRQRLWCG